MNFVFWMLWTVFKAERKLLKECKWVGAFCAGLSWYIFYRMLVDQVCP